MKTKIAVIGAGPAGLTAAYQLSKSKKFEIMVFESSGMVGGMSKTIWIMNQKVDIGPHRFFSSDPRVNRLWLEVAGNDYEMVDRLTRIYYGGKFYFYPLKALNALFNLGVLEACLCVLSYFWHRIFPKKDEGNFANWVTNRFGKRLFEIFFKSYTEKLWGISCNKLDSEFAAQRIKKLSLIGAIINAVFGGKKNKHKTLVDQFAYPRGGTGVIYEKMANSVLKNNGIIRLNTPIKKVINVGSTIKGIELIDGTKLDFDWVISSMPLTDLVANLQSVPEIVLRANSELKYRNTIIVYLKINHNELFPDQWLYIHSPQLMMGRLTNFRNWSKSLYGEDFGTILALEFWCYNNDDLWKMPEKDLIKLATEELLSTNLIKDMPVQDAYVLKIPKSYPVYNTGYKDKLTLVENHLRTIEGLIPIGRYGSFKYNNQDHSILMGLLASENILNEESHDLWSINTDYEYQESSRITATGLQEHHT